MKRFAIFVLLFALPMVLIALPVKAEIGAVGSPVVPSNAPKPAMEQPSAKSPQEEMKFRIEEDDSIQQAATASDPAANAKPLMAINFNQKRVYYSKSLEKAVKAAQSTKAGAAYYVVSYVPSGSSRIQNERITDETRGNLQGVINEMQYYGVPSSNITTITRSAPTGSKPKIEIFVQ